MQDAEDWLVPVALFVSIAVPVCLSIWLRARQRAAIQETIRVAIQHGQALTPEVLEGLGHMLPSRLADLRRGVFALALAIGAALFGFLASDQDVRQGMFLVAVFPLVLGIAYLGLWRFAPRE